MTKHTQTTDADATIPMGKVVRMTGINPVTLRAWERRHGLVKPVRTEGGHRLYSASDVARIRRAMELVARGMTIGQARQALQAEANAGAMRSAPDTWHRLTDAALDAVRAFDRTALGAVYEEALAEHPVDRVTRHLIIPILRHLGDNWADHAGGIAEEHFFTSHLRDRLGARLLHVADRPDAQPLVAACLPGEQHETGLLLFCLAAVARGYRVVMLGPDVPFDQVLATARRIGAPVVLSGTSKPRRGVLGTPLGNLAERLARPLFVGGPVAVARRRDLQAAHAIPIGTDIGAALDLIDSQLARPAADDGPSSVDVSR